MLVYPQLPTGSLAQFPVERRRLMRTIVNTAADGTVVKLADPGAATVEWQLKYAALSDMELAGLLQFFTAAEGTLNGFTFVDPTTNLLAWSEDLSNAVWDAAPFLSSVGANADPAGGKNTWQVTNSGAARRTCRKLYRRREAISTVSACMQRRPLPRRLRCCWEATVTHRMPVRIGKGSCVQGRQAASYVGFIRNRVGGRGGDRYVRFAGGTAGQPIPL